MKKRGMTLVELTIAMVLGTILLLAMTSQFLADIKFRKIITDQAAATQEAAIIMNHMSRILRFSLTTPAPAHVNDENQSAFTVTIEGGHNIAGIPVDTPVVYRRTKADNRFFYTLGAADPVEIASGVTAFPAPQWDPANRLLTIAVTLVRFGRSITVSTAIYTMTD